MDRSQGGLTDGTGTPFYRALEAYTPDGLFAWPTKELAWAAAERAWSDAWDETRHLIAKAVAVG